LKPETKNKGRRKERSVMRLFISLLFFSISHAVLCQPGWLTTRDFPGGPKTAFAGLEDSLLFVGTANGIWKSENEGFSWTKNLNSSYIFSLHMSEQGIVAGGKGKIFFSNDRGITWDSVSVPTAYPVDKIVKNLQQQYFIIASGFTAEAGFVGDGVLFNNGDLQTWQPRNSGIPANLRSAEQLAIDKNGRLYVAVPDEKVSGSGGLYISEDAGLNWNHIPFVVNNLGTVKAENTFSISLTPQDSVIVGVNGTAVNIAARLNLVKHIDDIANNSPWRPMRIRSTGNWWEDLILNEIHFAKNGDWYSSITSTLSQGGSLFSSNRGVTWSKNNQGVGISLTTQFERMFHYETSRGKMFMTQLLDSRVYWTTRSVIDPITISGKVVDNIGKPLMATIQMQNTQLFTNSAGEFSLTVSKGWSGKIAPSLFNYSFQPSSILLSNIQSSTRVANIIGTYIGNYFISGRVVDVSGEPVSGVLINGLPEAPVTNSFGFYVATVPARWTGTITPRLDGYSFVPTSISISEMRSDQGKQNFTMRKNGVVYIKGTVKDESAAALAGAELQGLPERTRINSNGDFIAQVPVNWSGTISASLDEYQFNSIQITEVKNDLVNQNIVGKKNTILSISGFVKDLSGQPMTDIAINGLPQSINTNSEGFFTVILPKGWSGTLIPISEKHTFTPAILPITNLTTPLISQNFVGAIVTSIDDSQDQVLQVFPNPSTDGIVYIGTSASAETQIVDTTGKVFQTINSNSGHTVKVELPRGFYIVNTILEGSSHLKRKLVV
jgi:hypothetical protein